MTRLSNNDMLWRDAAPAFKAIDGKTDAASIAAAASAPVLDRQAPRGESLRILSDQIERARWLARALRNPNTPPDVNAAAMAASFLDALADAAEREGQER